MVVVVLVVGQQGGRVVVVVRVVQVERRTWNTSHKLQRIQENPVLIC